MKQILRLLPLLLLSVVACQEKELPARLEVGQAAISAESPAGSTKVEFTATRPWTARTDASWCRVIPESGNGGVDAPGILYLIYEENPEHDVRDCVVTLESGGLSRTISLSQGHRTGIVLDTDTYSVSEQAQTLEITIWKTVPVSAETAPEDGDWISIVPGTKAMDRTSFTVSVQQNTSAARDGKIHFRSASQEETVTIHQAASDIKLADPGLNDYCHWAFDEDHDGCLSIDEALRVEGLDYSGWISDTKDLHFFPNIELLSCRSGMDFMDLSMLPSLKYLIVSGAIKGIDISKNNFLEKLDLSMTEIPGLNLDGKSHLTGLRLHNNSAMTELSMSGCASLTRLESTNNSALKALDLRSCTSLEFIYLEYHGSLETLLMGGQNHLTEMYCRFNDIQGELNLSGCSVLRVLECVGNRLTSLKLDGCTSLEELSCYSNRLESLDISSCPSLTQLHAYSNDISTFTSGQHPDLVWLFLANNLLTSISLDGYPGLIALDVSGNQLSRLEITGARKLQSIYCGNNRLTHLTVADCPVLELLDAGNNYLTSSEIRDNPILRDVSLPGNRLESISMPGCQGVEKLALFGNSLKGLDVSGYPRLINLNCHSNKLQALDLSPCSYLDELNCEGNELSTLDLTRNPRCRFIYCTLNPHLRTVLLIEGNSYNIQYDNSVTTLVYQ